MKLKRFEQLKKQPKLLMALGASLGIAAGGAVAWMLVQQKPTAVGLPAGSEVLPKETVALFSFSTDNNQLQQLQRLGTPESRAALDRTITGWRDRFLTSNNLSFDRDIKPWVGDEMTVAFLSAANQATDTPVIVLPIANPERAQQAFATPKTASGQEAVDRDYKGFKIREVHGQTERAYAATVIDNRLVVVSPDPKAVEQAIDVYRGKASVVQAPGYAQAFRQLETTTNPFVRLYLNVPQSIALAANNPMQPIPPQTLIPFQANQGLAAIGTVDRQTVNFEGIGWLPNDSKVRYRTGDQEDQITRLLPAETLLVNSGDSFKQFWQSIDVPQENAPRGRFNPELVRQSFGNLTGLDFDQDMVAWMDGEYAISLISAPPAAPAPSANLPTNPSGQPANPSINQPRAGILLLAQASDRRKAEQTFQKLDAVMGDRYRFQVTEAQLAGKPVTTWVSPFSSLSITHGWLDGNVAFIAIGPNLASTILPAPTSALAQNTLFQSATESDLQSSDGHFFLDLDRLATPNLPLPLPKLSADNQKAVNAIQAIGATTAAQDGRTMRYDIQILMNQSSKSPTASPSPNVSPSPNP